MYHIIGVDGRQYGPATEEQIRQWFAEGRLSAQTQFLAEGDSGWKPLSALSEFSDLVARGSPEPISLAQYGSAAAVKTNQMAMIGMIMGILSVTVGLCCYSMPFSILGIVFSIIGLSQIRNDSRGQQGRGMAIAGLILSISSLLIAIALIFFIALMSVLPELMRELKK